MSKAGSGASRPRSPSLRSKFEKNVKSSVTLRRAPNFGVLVWF
jgi:hypothetical protein